MTSDELRGGLRILADGFDRLATASIESYRETQREVTAHYDRVAGDLVAGLAGGELDGQQVRRLAQMLGGNPDDTWQAVAISVRADPDLAVSLRLLRDVLAALGRGRAGRILAGSARGSDVLLVPGSIRAADFGALERAVAGHAAAASIWVTVGEQVSGLPEAEASCRQALMAMDVAVRARPGGSVTPYGDVLLDVMATADADAGTVLVQRYVDPIREFPHLVETVLALAEADLSIRGAAASLYVHPNTVIYRLGRVRQLTGHDPRSLPELVSFLMGLRADQRDVRAVPR
nr:helix-turn-helix domain-containing protein [Phytoactinopolyspora alkaliphila]